MLPAAPAQQNLINAPEPSHAARPRVLPDRLPDKPSLAPVFKIPVGPLGFSAPGAYYLGQRTSLVSLDFFDEDRLLFTFRVPGLIKRDPAEREAGEDDQRQIRALVLKLPAGIVEAEALWTVHDRAPYLWMLKDGHFLLRDERVLDLGDTSLDLKPFLRFPGPLIWLDTDPSEEFLVADSREPSATAQKPNQAPEGETHFNDPDMSLHAARQQPSGGDREPVGLGTQEMAVAGHAAEELKPASQPDLVVRLLRRDSGQVILVSRTRTAIHLPLHNDGYLESLRARGNEWLVNLNSFSGKIATLGRFDSSCSPLIDVLSQQEVLLTGCAGSAAGKLLAMSIDGRHLWELQTSDTTAWPLLVKSSDGSRLARESLIVSTPVSPRAPLSSEEVKGQRVEIIDAADGNLSLETAASPALDAGGNVAISPSGRRVAVLNGGQIQVFELPAPPKLPEPAAHPPAR